MDLNTLNPQQYKAVTCGDGPLLILAGAGSGKTKALTSRIAYLLDNGTQPYEILALTFTNKAAREMARRVEELTGLGTVWISTFHSCCARMLRIDADRLGLLRDFVIYDSADQLSLLGQVIKDMGYSDEKFPKKEMKFLFSNAKNKSLHPDEYLRELGADERSRVIERIFARYQAELKKNNALDFDDLLLRTLELMDTCPDVLERYRERFRYILVDEYQDTNPAQYKLVWLLSKPRDNLTVVGDDDQSIYGWRGADIQNILGFERDFPNATVIRLEQNYRSTGNILAAANAVIAHNRDRKRKKLWTERGEGEKLALYTAWSDRDEADFVSRTINEADRRLSDFAVLYRTNAQSRVLEESFTGYGLSYTIYGSVSFYDRKEVKDVLAYLRLMVNPDDDVSLGRVINVPRRGIGEASLAEIRQVAQSRGLSMLEVCMRADEFELKSRSRAKIAAFGDLMVQLRALVELLPLSEFTRQLLELIRFWSHLEELDKKEGKGEEERAGNVREFVAAIAEFETKVPENTLSAFLENVSLVANVNDETGEGQVTLMTMHSAKGLEFPVVFLVGLEDGIFPSSRSYLSQTGMEEERRLCYVALTRAMEKLYLARASSRMTYNVVTRNPPSRFLGEIPPELIDDLSKGESFSYSEFGKGRQDQQAAYRPQDVPKPVQRPILGASQTTKPMTKNTYVFKVYQQVEHAKFGVGTVLDDDGGVLTIDFGVLGIKKIFGAYAPLKPLE